MSEFRRNPHTGTWVLIAPEATVRPRRRETLPERTSIADCPFCPGAELACGNEIYVLRTPGLLAGTNWSLRVIPNRLPMLRVEAANPGGSAVRIDGLGAHEVIIETPRHDLSLTDYPLDLLDDVLMCWRDRIRDLLNDMRLNYFVIHRAEGVNRISHPSSQLLAFPLTAGTLCGGRSLWPRDEYGPNPERRRILTHNGWLALAEYAQSVPFEIQIVPLDPKVDFVSLETLRPLTIVIRDIWRRLDLALAAAPIRLSLRYERMSGSEPVANRWRITLRPDLEMFLPESCETGIWTNPVPPEQAVGVLRSIPLKMSLPQSDYLLPLE